MANPIIVAEVSGPASSGYGISNGGQSFATGFTTTNSYSDVTVSAFLGQINGSTPFTGLMYLTTQIGPGTTQAQDEIASTAFTIDPGPVQTESLSVANLGPGSYYLSVFGTGNGSGFWDYNNNPTITLDTGVTCSQKTGSHSLRTMI